MKAGDIKKFLEKVIAADDRRTLNPKSFSINDNFLLNAVSAYIDGGSSEFLELLIDAFIETEELTVHRRVLVLKMVRDVLSGLAKPSITPEDRQRLRSLLTAYYI